MGCLYPPPGDHFKKKKIEYQDEESYREVSNESEAVNDHGYSRLGRQDWSKKAFLFVSAN